MWGKMHLTTGTAYGQESQRILKPVYTWETRAFNAGGGKGRSMGTIVHTSRISIVREKGPTRIARIEGFPEPVYYGVHGGIKNFYKVEPEKEHAATLDHIVGAVSA